MTRRARPPALPKIAPPRLGRVLPRAGVSKALEDALAAGVAWVRAPGGAGKTTAVAAYVAQRDGPVAWLHADAADGELASLFHYLGLAIAAALPAAADALPAYGPEFDADPQAFSRRYARAALSCAKGKVLAVVIDNLQDIRPDSPSHGALATLADEWAGAWPVAFVSREPPGGAYARLAGQGRLAVISPERLAFSEGELKEALRHRGIVDEAWLDRLWRRSGGWIAGAMLMAMGRDASAATDVGPDPAETAGLFSYFADQALGRLDPDDRRLLLATADLPFAWPEAAAALSGLATAGRRLEALASRGHFVERLGDEKPRYRYHDLFREFLLAQADRAMPVDERLVQKRSAATLLASHGEPFAALELLASGGEWAGFRDTLGAHAETLVATGHFRSLGALLDRVPEAVLADDPWLLYWAGQCRLSVDDDAAIGLLARSHALFEARGDAVGELIAGVQVPQLLRNAGIAGKENLAWVAKMEGLADQADAIRSPFLALRVYTGLASFAPFSRVLANDIGRLVRRVTRLMEEVADPTARLIAATQLVSLAWRRRLEGVAPPIIAAVEALRLEEQASPLVALHWLFDRVTWDTIFGDWQRAARTVGRCRTLAEATGLPSARFEAMLVMLEVACDRNDVAHARRLHDELETLLDPGRNTNRAYHVGFACRIALLQNDAAGALEAHRESFGKLRVAGMNVSNAFPYFMHEFASFALGGRYAEARDCAEWWRAQLDAQHHDLVDLHVAWIDAAESVEGGRPAAREDLRSAIATARRIRFPMVLRFANALSARLLARALEWDIETDFVREVIARRGLKAPDPAPAAWPFPVRVECLGAFRIRDADGNEPGAGRQQKTLDVLQFVIAAGGRSVPVDRIVRALWPGEGRVGAQQAFDTTLHRLRKLLGSESAIVVADRQVSIDPEVMWVDALAFASRLDALEAAPDERALGEALALYRGHLLAHRADVPWAAEARDRLWDRLRRLLLTAARQARDGGRLADSERILYFVADRDALAEDAFAELMRLHLEAGRAAEAARVYRRCAASLVAELGGEPGPELKALLARTQGGGRPEAPE